MREKLYAFTAADAKRAVAAIRKIEQMPYTRDQRRRSEPVRPPLGMHFRNTADEEMLPGSIGAIKDYLLSADEHYFFAEIEKPSTTFRRQFLVSTGNQSVAAGKYGYCLFEDSYRIKHDASWTPATGEAGGPKPDSWELWKGYPAISSVIGRANTSGKLLYGTLYEINTILCKATADLSAGPVSTNYVIWKGRRSSGADAGFTTLPTVELAADVPDDDFFIAHFVNGGWETSAGGEGGGDTIVEGTLPANNLLGSNPVNFTIDGNTESVLNPLAIPGGSGDKGLIVKSGSTYTLLNMQHIGYTVQTDYQVDGATAKFQKKTRTARGPRPGNEGSFTDVHTGEECA